MLLYFLSKKTANPMRSPLLLQLRKAMPLGGKSRQEAIATHRIPYISPAPPQSWR
ncbi:MAG TPA: hypothetical protein V6C63_00625 [Allocoleopsis sp.]